MKAKHTTDSAARLIVEYLTRVADHSGYIWDGLEIEPGTAVASFKTIAAETGLSYYRAKKRLAALAEAGVITIARHKYFAVITLNTLPAAAGTQSGKGAGAEKEDSPVVLCASNPYLSSEAATVVLPREPVPMPFNRAQRRRLARECAKMDRRIARQIAAMPPERRNIILGDPSSGEFL